MALKFPLVEDFPFMSHPDFVTCESIEHENCMGAKEHRTPAGAKQNLQRNQLTHRSAPCQRRCLCCPSSHLSSHVSLFYVVMISAFKALGESLDNLISSSTATRFLSRNVWDCAFKCSWCISENTDILSAEKVAASVVSYRVQKDFYPKCFWSETNTTMNLVEAWNDHWSTIFLFEHSWLSAVFSVFFYCLWLWYGGFGFL